MGVANRKGLLEDTPASRNIRATSYGLDFTKLSKKQIKTWKRYEMRNLIKELEFKEDLKCKI
jgi:hypothetical protein